MMKNVVVYIGSKTFNFSAGKEHHLRANNTSSNVLIIEEIADEDKRTMAVFTNWDCWIDADLLNENIEKDSS